MFFDELFTITRPLRMPTKAQIREMRIQELQALAEQIGLRWGGVDRGKVSFFFDAGAAVFRGLPQAEEWLNKWARWTHEGDTDVWFARALFGPHAARIVVTAEWRDVVPEDGQEMDEPCKAAYVTEFIVYDQRGRPLAPDLRLPHWQERIAQPDLVDFTGATREATVSQVLQAAYTYLNTIAMGSHTYRLETPPAPNWPPLYVGGDGPPYRPASEAEMELAVRDWGLSNTWDFYARFARNIYGPRAARIDVSGQSMEPDPEAWPVQDRRAVAYVLAVVVADAGGTRLAPDLSTPWWQEWFGRPEVMAMAEEERTAAMTEAIQSYLATWPFVPTEYETYWVDMPPAPQGPILYVREPFERISSQAPRQSGVRQAP